MAVDIVAQLLDLDRGFLQGSAALCQFVAGEGQPFMQRRLALLGFGDGLVAGGLAS